MCLPGLVDNLASPAELDAAASNRFLAYHVLAESVLLDPVAASRTLLGRLL